jgi:hypothetical protein
MGCNEKGDVFQHYDVGGQPGKLSSQLQTPAHSKFLQISTSKSLIK